jgi:subtilisin family serine protease
VYPRLGAMVARLTTSQAATLDARPGVTVSPDGPVSTEPMLGARTTGPGTDGRHGVFEQREALSWGLDRMDQRDRPLSGTYNPHIGVDGQGTHVFVLDTGLAVNHSEFADRVGSGIDIVDADDDPSECAETSDLPHGSHVAGTIASSLYGVGPKAILHGVRVLRCGGSGSWSDVVAGMAWVVGQRVAIGRTVVANMSLGGEFNKAVNAATTNMINSGVVAVVAAGNSSDNACKYSPASTPKAITVAATDSTDASAWFSNFGRCVDLYAPGVDIRSTYARDPGQNLVLTGTSMASPHVAGWAALYLELHRTATPQDVREALLASGTTDRVTGAPPQTPNILPYTEDVLIPTAARLSVSRNTALRVNVHPSSDEVDYRVHGQVKREGRWVTRWTSTTAGSRDTLRRNVGAGSWRVKVPPQFGQPRAVSSTVRVTR